MTRSSRDEESASARRASGVRRRRPEARDSPARSDPNRPLLGAVPSDLISPLPARNFARRGVAVAAFVAGSEASDRPRLAPDPAVEEMTHGKEIAAILQEAPEGNGQAAETTG